MNGFEPVKGKVEIVEYDLINLVEHREFLRSLESAGVDNWKSYNVAVDFFEREKLKTAANNSSPEC